MPAVRDFRTLAFDVDRVDASGKNIGETVYWKLYAIENVVRVIAHSILTVEFASAAWWSRGVDGRIRQRIDVRKADHSSQPWHTKPGRHDIYYAQLPELTKILASNSNLFKPLIPKIDELVRRLEEIRLPRNVVGHMNWLSARDRERIDVLYSEIQALMNRLSRSGLAILIP